MPTIRIGDIFEIPLSGKRKAYGQFVFKDKEQGPLVQIFNLIVDKEVTLDLDVLRRAKPLFPPIITGLQAAIRTGLWHVVGKLAIPDVVYPKFVSAYYDEKTGEAYRWFVWDGEKYVQAGSRLPDEYKALEYLVVWSPFDVADRIETGEYPYPYGDLIKHNRFVPGRKLDRRT